MYRDRRCRRWIGGLVGLGLWFTGCEMEGGCDESNRSPTDDGVEQIELTPSADIPGRPDSRTPEAASTRKMSSNVPGVTDSVLPQDLERELAAYTTALLASRSDSTDRSGDWDGLWDLLATNGFVGDEIPLEVAPFWMLAAVNTDRLSGCPDDWLNFMTTVISEFKARHPDGHPSEEFMYTAAADLALWVFDFAGHEATAAAAQEACEQP